MKTKKEVKIEKPSYKPTTINKDVWFYESKKSLFFVVWSKKNKIGERTVTNFRLPLRKLLKYYDQSN